VVSTVLGSGPGCAKSQRRVTHSRSCPLNKFNTAAFDSMDVLLIHWALLDADPARPLQPAGGAESAAGIEFLLKNRRPFRQPEPCSVIYEAERKKRSSDVRRLK
jgi:hypothetical protein